MAKKCPKAEIPGACPVCFPDVVEAKMKQLDRLGDCLQTLAQTQELFEEKTLKVTTDQLNSWALLCHHIALWVPENLAEAARCQEIGRKPTSPAAADGKLDPVAKENILKDAEKLQDIASQIQFTAEAMCHDWGFELPKNIKERIAKEKAARAGQGGAAC
jgi:hypothetical protein